MESIDNLNAMKPLDHLVESGKAWILGRKNHYIVYLPEGGSITLNLENTNNKLQARWYNPRTGTYLESEYVGGNKKQRFRALNEKDWVLHISN
jgi:hypothetical protein